MDITGWALVVCAVFGAIGWAYAAGQYHANKRPISVHQEQHNHAAPVTVNGESGGLGIAPALIGGLFKVLLVGIALTLVANLIMGAIGGIGQGLQAIGNGLSQQAEPQQITVVYPTPIPLQTVAPVIVPQAVPVPVVDEPDLLPVIVGVLAVAALGLWGYVAVTLLRRKPIKRNNVVTPRNVSAREVFGVASNVKTKETVRH